MAEKILWMEGSILGVHLFEHFQGSFKKLNRENCYQISSMYYFFGQMESAKYLLVEQ